MENTDQCVERIAGLASEHGLHVGVAESLTCGLVASRLGAGPNASEWFRGALVAYDADIKFDVLGVSPGPVVTEECARQMARGVADLLGVDYAVACTGVGGPDESEGCAPGTVFVAVAVPEETTSRQLSLDGGPDQVLRSATEAMIDLLLREIVRTAPDVTR